jgi:hypothetical protein
MKSNSEIQNVNTGLRPKLEHWFLSQCNELAELRRQKRQRELAQPGLKGGIYADHDVVHRR